MGWLTPVSDGHPGVDVRVLGLEGREVDRVCRTGVLLGTSGPRHPWGSRNGGLLLDLRLALAGEVLVHEEGGPAQTYGEKDHERRDERLHPATVLGGGLVRGVLAI